MRHCGARATAIWRRREREKASERERERERERNDAVSAHRVERAAQRPLDTAARVAKALYPKPSSLKHKSETI